eukprot:3760367-Pyramimonas_sp.AAC.1
MAAASFPRTLTEGVSLMARISMSGMPRRRLRWYLVEPNCFMSRRSVFVRLSVNRNWSSGCPPDAWGGLSRGIWWKPLFPASVGNFMCPTLAGSVMQKM